MRRLSLVPFLVGFAATTVLCLARTAPGLAPAPAPTRAPRPVVAAVPSAATPLIWERDRALAAKLAASQGKLVLTLFAVGSLDSGHE